MIQERETKLKHYYENQMEQLTAKVIKNDKKRHGEELIESVT
jgi:hypothetical protein